MFLLTFWIKCWNHIHNQSGKQRRIFCDLGPGDFIKNCRKTRGENVGFHSLKSDIISVIQEISGLCMMIIFNCFIYPTIFPWIHYILLAAVYMLTIIFVVSMGSEIWVREWLRISLTHFKFLLSLTWCGHTIVESCFSSAKIFYWFLLFEFDN